MPNLKALTSKHFELWPKVKSKKVNVWIIVQLSKDLMDWVSRRLCYAVGDTDRPVSWTSVYSPIRRTCPGGDGVCTHVNSRRKALLYRDSNLQPGLSLYYKPSTETNCALSAPQVDAQSPLFYMSMPGLHTWMVNTRCQHSCVPC